MCAFQVRMQEEDALAYQQVGLRGAESVRMLVCMHKCSCARVLVCVYVFACMRVRVCARSYVRADCVRRGFKKQA
jgi:hypothetical protein